MPRNRHPPAPGLSPQILSEAAEWFIELDEEAGTADRRRAFDAWLRRSPEHVRAFLELLPVWEQGAVKSANTPAPAALIERAVGASPGVAILPLPLSRPESAPPSRRSYLAAAASVAFLICAGIVLGSRFLLASSYSTDIAEQRSLVLDDGSSLELNARTRVRVRFTANERRVDLLEGQALFGVARDAERPFVVYSGGVRVRAIGTQFDVYRRPDRTTVTVLEGRVAVLPPADVPPAVLSAGEQTTATPAAVAPPRTANLAAATAWTQRQLMFQKTSLAEVAEEFNRFNHRQLRIEDSGIRAFLVSGTFSSTDPASLLRFLRGQAGIRVIETKSEFLIAAE